MNDWISVKERLPEKSGMYFVIALDNWITTMDYSAKHKTFNANDWNDDKFIHDNEIHCKYWMPIPKLPEDCEDKYDQRGIHTQDER